MGPHVVIPCTLVVEEAICPLLVLFRDLFGLFVPLKPCLVLLVESPALILERLCCETLLISALTVVENVEQRVCLHPSTLVECRVIKQC